MRTLFSFCTLAVATALLPAQSVTLPPAAANAEGNSSTGTLWSSTSTTSAMRHQMFYAGSTMSTLGGGLSITRLRWRANGASTCTGGSFANVTINMCTSATPVTAPSSTFASNYGTDLTTVFTGTVTVAPITTATTPNAFYIDVPLTTPFTYVPTSGDLLVEVMWPTGSFTGGTVSTVDYQIPAGTPAARLYSTSASNPATGSLNTSAGVVINFDYTVLPGYGQSQSYGTGCNDTFSSFYEAFTGATFDLGGSASTTNSILCTPNAGGGYDVTPGSGNFFTPVSADMLLSDDSLTASLPLGFNFPYANGTATTPAIKMCSNGFLWLRDTETSTDLSPTPAELLTLGPRIAPFWGDLNPAQTDPSTLARVGSIHFDIDPSSNDAVCTWLNVPEFGAANFLNQNTFQVVLQPSGAFELRWRNILTTASRALFAGVSQGLGARDPGAIDISAALPFATAADQVPVLLTATTRPVMGTALDLDVGNVPATAQFGLLVFGFTQFNPGIDLTSIGMPTCMQFVSIDATASFAPGGPAPAFSAVIPNAPIWNGAAVYVQAVVLAPGANPLGVLASNGVALTIGAL